MNKVIKWIMWALIAVGVVLTGLVFFSGYSEASINNLLLWTYAIVAVALVCVLFGIARDAAVNPKTLIRIAVVLVGTAVIIAVAYFLAPGTPAVGYNGAPVSDSTLKLTDTILNLTYFAIGASLVAIVASIVWDAVKGK